MHAKDLESILSVTGKRAVCHLTISRANLCEVMTNSEDQDLFKLHLMLGALRSEIEVTYPLLHLVREVSVAICNLTLGSIMPSEVPKQVTIPNILFLKQLPLVVV